MPINPLPLRNEKMNFESRYEALTSMCRELAKVMVDNQEILEAYRKYESKKKAIEANYRWLTDDMSPNFVQTMVQEHVEQLQVDSSLESFNPKYVSTDQKQALWNKFTKGKKAISYKELDRHLSSIGIETKSSALFFRNQTAGLKRVGGTRNKKVCLTR